MPRAHFLAALPLLVLGACASHGPHAVSQATPAQKSVLLDRMKSLEGEWQKIDEHGVAQTTNVFKVTSNGSAVREIMFPNTDHEMINLYHMDGPDLVLTHYCAMGNQPRMKAAAGNGRIIEFKIDSVGNWAGPAQLYMGAMRLEITDENHIAEHWTHFENDKAAPGADFVLTRKK